VTEPVADTLALASLSLTQAAVRLPEALTEPFPAYIALADAVRLAAAFTEPLDSLTLKALLETIAEPCTAPPPNAILNAATETVAAAETAPDANLSRNALATRVPVPFMLAVPPLILSAFAATDALAEIDAGFTSMMQQVFQIASSSENASVSMFPK
jgi:hypothetical protein